MKRVGVAGLVAAAVIVAGVPAAAAPREAEPVSPAGADLVSVTLDGRDRLSLQLRTADGQAHDPADVLLPETAGIAGAVPDHRAYRFLGAPGRPVWAVAPVGTELPAWDTTGVPAGQSAGDTVTLELLDVDGPGGFHAYAISPVGQPRLLFGTSPAAPARTELPAGVRRGGTVWVFDTPGSHVVTLAASATLTSGETVTDQASYQVEVPALDADLAESETAPLAAPAARLAQQDAETGDGQVVIGDGHVDIGPRFVDDAWTIQVKDDTVSPHVWRNLHDVVLQVVDEAIIQVPEGEDFDFLGEPGDEVWLLPQAQQAGIIWPGWNTEHESVVSAISGDTTWRLRAVDGPGAFVLFLTGSFGQSQILFDSQESLPQEMSIPLRTHAHGNWAFTQPGVYHLTLEISATTSQGEEVSDTRVLAFAVGDQTDPGTAFPPAGGNGKGDGNGDRNGGGALSTTGLAVWLLVVAGAVLVAGGTVLVLLTVRRRSRAASES